MNYDEWGGFFDHVAPPRALAPNAVDPDVVDGKAMLGCRTPCIIASPWTRGNPNTPRINSTVFDHTSVLKLIETVWDVPPVAARETSEDVGNLLSALDLTAPNAQVPALPNPNFLFPSSFCFSSIDPTGLGLADSEPTVFQLMIDSGMLKGFPGH